MRLFNPLRPPNSLMCRIITITTICFSLCQTASAADWLDPDQMVDHIQKLQLQRGIRVYSRAYELDCPSVWTDYGLWDFAYRDLRLPRNSGCTNTTSVSPTFSNWCAGWSEKETKTNINEDDRCKDSKMPRAFLGKARLSEESTSHQTVSFGEIPFELVAAVISTEDRRFLEHQGIDPAGITRAIFRNIKEGRIAQGGSTITQQMVKNYFFSYKKELTRKVKEAIIATKLEEKLPKEIIMGAYLNGISFGTTPYGADIKGVGEAARFYFGKDVSELNVSESLMLVGLIRGPSFYNPYTQPARLSARISLIAKSMADEGFISRSVERTLKEIPKSLLSPKERDLSQSHILEAVRLEIPALIGEAEKENKTYDVGTSASPALQRIAAETLQLELTRFEESRKIKPGSIEGSLLLMDSADGKILAAVGGRYYASSQFSRAYLGTRPIGSLIKPFLLALAKNRNSKLSQDTLVEDRPIEIAIPRQGLWKPKNYDGKFYGSLPLRKALAQSLNTPFVRLGYPILKDLHKFLEILHLKGDAPPSWLLGTMEMTPKQVAEMYTAIARADGKIVEPKLVEYVASPEQNLTISTNNPTVLETSLEPETWKFVRELLRAPLEKDGTAHGAWPNSPTEVLGKTGTTSNYRDAWFVGILGRYVLVVWTGVDQGEANFKQTGGSAAVPIAKKFFEQSQKYIQFFHK